jgi:hypothetical protein
MVDPDIAFDSDSINAHDPGGKVSIPLPRHVRGSAVFGGLANEYRYRSDPQLGRRPAGHVRDDESEHGRSWVGRPRATDQHRLAVASDPMGPENNDHLPAMALDASLVGFADVAITGDGDQNDVLLTMPMRSCSAWHPLE